MEEVLLRVKDMELKRVMGYFEELHKDIVSLWDLINEFDDALNRIDELEEEVDTLKDNQKTFNPYKEYGVSESDFH